MSKDKLVIFDTTVRDGEQSPGAPITKDEKIWVAKMLEKMRVDVIKAINAVAEVVRESWICSLFSANRKDIDRAAEASRIYTFISTSPLHIAIQTSNGA